MGRLQTLGSSAHWIWEALGGGGGVKADPQGSGLSSSRRGFGSCG